MQQARVETLAECESATDIPRNDRRRQAIFRVIRQRDRFVVVFERHEDRDRSEDFLAEGRHCVADSLEYGRRKEQSFRRAARENFRPLRH